MGALEPSRSAGRRVQWEGRGQVTASHARAPSPQTNHAFHTHPPSSPTSHIPHPTPHYNTRLFLTGLVQSQPHHNPFHPTHVPYTPTPQTHAPNTFYPP